MSAVLIVLLCAAINAFRGGGVIPATRFEPPGHRRWYAGALMVPVGWIALPEWQAVYVALCWVVWSIPAWGRWYTLGRGARSLSGSPDAFERAIERIVSFGLPQVIEDHLALALRNVVVLAPLALLSPAAFLIVLVGMSFAYEACWRIWTWDKGPTGKAEWLTGAAWGLAILAI